jgi:outer membrane protein, multidrug efflux system
VSHRTFIVSLLAGLVLAGCSTTRQGGPPEVPVAGNWSHPVKAGVTNTAAWWEQYRIPELNRIVQTALASNANLAILVQRVELARADSRVATAGSRPFVNADTSIRAGNQRSRVTDFETESLLPGSAGAVASWELDWLGKWRHRRTAARDTVKASQADLAAGQVLLTAEVVGTWFQFQQHHHEAATIRQSLDFQQQILAIYHDRHQAGLVETAVLERQQAKINDFQRQIAQSKMRQQIAARKLDHLQGRTSRTGNYQMQPWAQETPTPNIPGILPAEALRRRPDLLASEARLRAAWSIAHAAKLDLYPSLDLRLGGVTMTGSLTDPFRSWMTQVGPRVQIPLWDPNRRATAKATSARAQLAASEYRANAIRAIEETEAALITHHRTREQLDHAIETSQHASNVVTRTADRLGAGLVSQLDLFTDQSQALNARLTVIRLQSVHQATFATLQRSLGF